MAHYKRRKPRRQVKCNICTDSRVGNGRSSNGRKPQPRRTTSLRQELNIIPSR